jgi:hypothetical protein
VVGGTFAITQFASAEDNPTACAETAQASTLRRGGAGHGNHGGGQQQQPNTPAEDEAPPAEGAPEAPPAEEGQQPEAPPAEEGQQPPAEEPEAPPAEEPEAPPAEEPEAPPAEEPEAPPAEDCEEGEEGEEAPPASGGVPPGGANGDNNGLDVLGRDCTGSDLAPHAGFQDGGRCVNTAMGEVSNAAQNPSLLIVSSPLSVRANRAFTLRISTRNLVRDRFLGAAAGGYYLETSVLNDAQLQRGHFHLACRMLDSLRNAPDPEPVPAFFRAVEDGGGGGQPDTVSVEVTGLPRRGIAQCAAWAGDGSHRAPMMQRANQTPAFDAVRIVVR